MSDILTGFNMQGNDPIDDRIVSKNSLETLEQYLNRVPVQKRYYGLTFFALDKNNELRKYTFQTSLINPTIDDYEEEIERIDKELQEHVSNKAIHKTSEEIRSEIVDTDIPNTIARVQWTLDQINTAVINLIGGASDEYNTLKRIQTKIEELRAKIYGDDGGTVLKTLEQALKFLNQYKDFIVDTPENFVNKQDIVDNLTTDDPTKVLSAKQGKVLSDTLTNYFESAMQSIRTETDRAINAENRIETKLDEEIDRSIKEDQRIDSKLDSEINRSTTEDDRLDKKIDAETTRATDAESNLNTKIETETDRAESEESRIETKLDNEIARSTNKDTEHDNRLTALEGDTYEQNTDLGTTNSTFQLKYNTGNKIKHESDAISVRNAADTDYVNFIAKNATFKGDILVEGQSFVTEAETVEIKDNLLLLNKGEVGAGVTKGIAGLEIDRGTEPNYQIIFDESDNRFKAGVEGDLWNLALRESDNNMLDGYFISWNSKDKILSTTNIVNESTPLLFGRTDYKRYSGYKTYQEGSYSSYSFIDETPSGFLYNSAGDNDWNIDTSKLNFRFWKPILGTTFRRKSDNSEVLYHADIVNNLTSGGTNKVLSAEQGKILQNSITSIQGSYLPLSGGTLTGTLKINSGESEPLVINNSASAGEAYVVTKTQGTTRGVMGWSSSLGMFLQDSRGYTFSMKADGVYFGASSSTLTKLPTPTDLSGYLPLAGGTMTGALTMSSRRHNIVVDVVGGAGNTWEEGAGALSVQVPADAGQTPLILARRSGAAINTTVAEERLLSMELLDTGHTFIIGMSGSEALQLDWTSGRVGTGKLFGKTIATTDQIPSIPSISISNSGSGNAVTAISASGHTLTVTKGATYLTSHQTIYDLTFQAGTFAAKTFDPNGAAATVNIPTSTSHLTNDSGFITSSALSGYTTQEWVNGQGFLTSDSLLDKFVPTTGGYIRNSDQVLLRLQRTGVSTGASRTIEMYFDDSNNDGTNITPRGSIGYNSELGMFLQDSRGYTFSMKADGVYFGASSSTLTKLPTPTDLSGYLPLAGGTMTGALTMSSRRHNIVVDVVGGAGNTWEEGAGALSVQVPADAGQTPLILARRSGAAINTTVAEERLLSMELLDTGHTFIIGMSGSEALQLDWTSGRVGTGKLFGKTIATTDQIPSIPSISISNSGSGNAVTAISASGHTLTVTKGATYLTSHQTIYDLTFQAGTFAAKTFDPNGAAATVNIPTSTSHLTNDSGFITSSALSGYTTQEWVNGQGFLTSDSLLDKFVPTTGGYIRNSDQVLLRLQRTGVSTGASRTIEMYFDDSNNDGTNITPRGSIGYNSELGMFLYSAKSKNFLAMENTGRPFYGTPENRYYLLGSNTQYHNLDGYQRIGDIMIQWGYFSVQGNSTRAVNFSVSFTDTVWSVTGSWDNTTSGSQENWGFTDYTSSGFTIINGDGSSRVFHYIAIGPFTKS